MSSTAAPPARLYVLVARQRRRAVIFRRGPAKRTLVLGWDLADDTIERGQWFKGRVYERRCDLSPDGDLLVCNVGSHRPPLYSWTAISRPPYLTALALWTNHGIWGGGLFGDDWTSLRLNHLSPVEAVRPTDQMLPSPFKVSLIEPALDEEALVSLRLERDGWVARTEGTSMRLPRGSRLWTRIDPPTVRERSGPGGMTLQVALHGTGEANGSPYVETGQVVDQNERVLVDLGRIDWADLDHNGDVLYAARGCIHRLRNDQIGATQDLAQSTKIADLNALEFDSVIAPDWATRWP